MESPLVIVAGRFLKPTEPRYLDAHQQLTHQLYTLVGEAIFRDLASAQGLHDWKPVAEQACEDYARYLLLESEHNPLKSDARTTILDQYNIFIGAPEQATISRNAAIH